MAKVLIALIGTGRLNRDNKSKREYEPVKYSFDGKELHESSFISAILAKKLKVDKIIFIGTAKSMWEEVYRFFAEDDMDENYWMEIAELTDKSNVKETHLKVEELEKIRISIDDYLRRINPKATGGSEIKLIDYGIDEGEIWNNFDTIMGIKEYVDMGDEIYLDITHSFRSIPMLLYLLIDFFKTLYTDRIELSGIYYGMLEVIRDLGYAPIVDLGPLFKISELAKGAYDFINYGNSYLISKILKEENLINDEIYKKMNNASDLININYLNELKVQMESLRRELGKIEIGGVLKFINPLIIEFLDRFYGIESDSQFQLELSRWYLENKKYGHAYICLAESMVTRMCEIYDVDTGDFRNRRYMGHLISNWGLKRQSDYLKEAKLDESFKAINKIRNRTAHAEFYSNTQGQFRSDINLLNHHIDNVDSKINDKRIEKLPMQISLDDIKRSYANRMGRS